MASDNTVPTDVKEELEGLRTNRSVACLEKANETKSIRIKELQDEITKKDEQVKEMKTRTDDLQDCVREKDEKMQKLSNTCAEKSGQIDDMTRLIAEMELSAKKKNEELQLLNTNVGEKHQKIEEMIKEITALQLRVEEKDDLIQELTVNIAERDKQIKGLALEITNLQHSLKEKDEVIQKLKSSIDEWEQKLEVKSQEVQRLNDCVSERNSQIKSLTDGNLKLKENVSLVERELLVNKQLQNAMKLRELEKVKSKSQEIERVILKIKEETASIARNLGDRDVCQPVKQTDVAASAAKETPLPSRLTGASCKRIKTFKIDNKVMNMVHLVELHDFHRNVGNVI
jgi:DNA repair exonuclease SbcCD ATPase subunit